MPTKKELTILFLEQAGQANVTKFVLKEYMKEWWTAPHSPIGLRLTPAGNSFLKKELKLSFYSFTIPDNTTKSLKLFLQLNKNLTAPYYLSGQNTIITYGESDAVMLSLYCGDIATYMNNFSR